MFCHNLCILSFVDSRYPAAKIVTGEGIQLSHCWLSCSGLFSFQNYHRIQGIMTSILKYHSISDELMSMFLASRVSIVCYNSRDFVAAVVG